MSDATKRLAVDLTVDEWELLGHGLATAASHYRRDTDPAHAGVSEDLDALILKLRRHFGAEPQNESALRLMDSVAQRRQRQRP